MLPAELHDTWASLLMLCYEGPTVRHQAAAARALARDIQYRRALKGRGMTEAHFAMNAARLPAVSFDADDPAPALAPNTRLARLFFWYDEAGIGGRAYVGGGTGEPFEAGEPLSESEPDFVGTARTEMGSEDFDDARAPWVAAIAARAAGEWPAVPS